MKNFAVNGRVTTFSELNFSSTLAVLGSRERAELMAWAAKAKSKEAWRSVMVKFGTNKPAVEVVAL